VQCAGHTFNNCKGKMQQSRWQQRN
jgi:hypothetical protein